MILGGYMSNNGLDILGLSKPLEKLIDCFSGAVGVLYEPHRTRKKADAEAYRILTTGNAVKQLDFNGEFELDGLKIKVNEQEDPLELKSLISNEVKRLFQERENTYKIADIAYEELKDDTTKVDKDIDKDWSQFFFETGKKIYNEDIQFIFGKILAGEIKEPGSYSKRLIEVLARLSQKEAEIFQKISKVVFRGVDMAFVLSDKELLKECGISLNDILVMEEAGLMNSTALVFHCTKGIEYHNYLISFGENDFNLDVYALTKSGIQLERLIKNDLDLDFLKKVKEKLNIEHFSYATIVSSIRDGNGIDYTLTDGKELE